MRASSTIPAGWRILTVVGSVAGLAVLVLWLGQLDPVRPGYLLLCAMPLLVGGVAGLGTMTARVRIVLLWLAALMCGLTAVVTIMTGAGIVLLAAMLVYLIAAWGINEAG